MTFLCPLALVDNIKADHGFRAESRAFKNLLSIMSGFNNEERRQFLQFITGSPKLPIGGTVSDLFVMLPLDLIMKEYTLMILYLSTK